MRGIGGAVGLFLGLIAACTAAEPVPSGTAAADASAGREEMLQAPVPGTTAHIAVRLCRATAEGRAPLVLINHGAPVDPAARSRFRPAECGSEAVRWFLQRGYAVALPLRRGYGASDGPYAEGSGSCEAPDYARSATEAARDMRAALEAVRARPDIRPDGVVVVGQSAGGWGTVGLAADPPAGVVALVSMAGGRGRASNIPNLICRPDLLVREAGHLGATARTPMLWVYTANDQFFEPRLAAAMHAAFTAAGGQAELQQLAGWGRDGHALFVAPGGSAVWGPLVERYLVARGAGASAP